jgi:hypothetical protein
MEQKHTTIEYTPTICSCGKELSTLFYFLTAKNSFMHFAKELGIPQKDVSNMGFYDPTPNIDLSTLSTNGRDPLILCCLKTLRYGNTSPISAFKHNEVVFRVKSKESTNFGRKYPEALPGPLSSSETLSWL